MRLDHMGYNSYMIGDTNFPKIDSDTLCIINSSSGETETNILYANQAIKQGSKTLLISASSQSSLHELCDFHFIYS